MGFCWLRIRYKKEEYFEAQKQRVRYTDRRVSVCCVPATCTQSSLLEQHLDSYFRSFGTYEMKTRRAVLFFVTRVLCLLLLAVGGALAFGGDGHGVQGQRGGRFGQNPGGGFDGHGGGSGGNAPGGHNGPGGGRPEYYTGGGTGGVNDGLYYDIYRFSCPQAEQVIFDVVQSYIHNDPTLAPALLRMHFHDAFVQGADASVLIDSTPTNSAEKDAFPNKNSLRGFEVIDACKAVLEQQCPGVVSCADVLTVAARDSVRLALGPFWDVPLGRRDGLTSSAAAANVNLPSPFSNFQQLVNSFKGKGLNVNDLVILSGAHTIGRTHCGLVNQRIYNFTGHGDADPSLNNGYVYQLKQECKPTDLTTAIPMDPYTPAIFDTQYYKSVSQNKGIFPSDAALLQGGFGGGGAYVSLYGASPNAFFTAFPNSIVKMGRIGVLTGQQGQIRKNCRVVN